MLPGSSPARLSACDFCMFGCLRLRPATLPRCKMCLPARPAGNVGRDWLPKLSRHMAHPAPFGAFRPCLVALLVLFSCFLSCRCPPPSRTAPSSRSPLPSRCRLARCLAGTFSESAGDEAVLAIKHTRVAARVTTLTLRLSFRHSSGANSPLAPPRPR